jgi:hypothetical protein
VRWLGILVCLVAAYRLRVTPLWTAAAAVAAVSVVCAVVPPLLPRAANGRMVTALQHVCAALGGFFLFVSLAMR